MADDRYEVVWFRGHRFDKMTVQALMAVETALGYELTVAQGSYNQTVAASGGTHNGGGAVDLAPYDAARKQRVMREVGHFACWERQPIPGVWGHHVHGILIGNLRASSAALNQVTAYRNRRDGLARNGGDNSWHPANITPWRYRVEPTIGISVTHLRIDFFNALDGRRNPPSRRGRAVQRQLNRKLGGNKPLTVDGVVGDATLDRWGAWEHKNGVVDRPRIPDLPNTRALLKGSVYFAVP